MQVDLYKEIYELVKQVPKGRVSAYKDIAKALGDDRIAVARAVARVLNENEDLETIPCYRVVHSDGRIGGYKLGIEEKIKRLQNNGIRIENNKIVNFDKLRFNQFKSRKILKLLQKEQRELRSSLVLKDVKNYRKVAGVDAGYKGKYCIAVCATENEVAVAKEKIRFPYIPGYLSYRESNAMMKAIGKINADIYLIDGNGILHPRCLGIASHIGVLLNIPTIGVAKRLLMGEIKGDKIFVRNEQRGWVIKRGHFAPLYVSPGHLVSLETCKRIVTLNLKTHRLPEPLYKAHRIAKEECKR